MGFVVVRARVMPSVLGWVLMAGGVGYVVSAYVIGLWPDAPAGVASALPALATIGELWMIGYLLLFGIRSAPARLLSPQ